MRHHRAVVAALATSIILAGYTVVEADDDVPDTTTTTEAPAPSITEAITITVAPPDEPDPEPVATEAPADTVTTPDETVVEAATPTSETTVAAVVASTTTNVQQTHDETAIVTGTQVAVGDSGNNTAINEQPTTGSTVAPGGDIDTGSATAVGSSDENTITQAADVVLTDEAVANILQIALVINIGAALANSGLNGIASSPGGNGSPGAIGTGNATAVGNDIDQYLTQGARVDADEDTDDAANQLAISMFLGLAVANSGLNSVTGTGVAGSGGGIGAGDATAIGNDSLTDVDQQAAVLGSGQSVTNITQRATILNLGFALANSGLNGIEGVASNLLTAGSDANQDQVAQDLFVMLLPALLQSYGYMGAGSGQIGTGDATAVGNRSETYVQQIAAAVASGDGIASIVQDVLVANVGAAGANTGGNQLGRSIAQLDEPTARAVVMMSAFLAQLLSMVHQTANQLTSAGIEIPFGDLVLQLNGSFGALDTTLSKGGARVNMRQISIVLSLGVAKANTGLNQVTTVQPGEVAVDSQTARAATAEMNTDAAVAGAEQTLAAIDALPSQIRTGDVTGRNTNLVIICQRYNAQDVACLAPPPPPVVEPPVVTTTTQPGTETTVLSASNETTPLPQVAPVAVTTTVPGPQGFTDSSTRGARDGVLPGTGSNVDVLLVLAAIAAAGGAVLVLSARRRRPAEDA